MAYAQKSVLRRERESQAVSLRHAILKASGSELAFQLRRRECSEASSPDSSLRSGSAPLFKKLEDADTQYKERLSALHQFKNKSKSATKQSSLKSDWMKEQQHLRAVAQSTERDTLSVLEILLLHAPADESLKSLLDESLLLSHLRETNQKDLIRQVVEIRGMFKDTAKALRNAAQERSSSGEEVASAASAVFADILVQVRASQNDVFGVTCTEEAELSRQVASIHRGIVGMLQQDRLELQNETFSTHIRHEQGDDSEVAMAMEEWYARLAALDRAHAAELLIIKEERERVNETGGGQWASEADRISFTKIYSRAQSAGIPRRKLLEQLALQLPHKSATEIEKHEAWYRSCHALGHRKKVLTSEYEAAREKLVAESKVQLEAFRKQRCESIEAAQRLAQHENSRMQLHQALEELRAARAKSDALMREQKERDDMLLAEENQISAQLAKAEQDWKKRQVEIYKQVRQQISNQLAAEQARLQEEARINTLASIEANRGKVDARERARLAKEEEVRKRELLAVEEEARRVDSLMRLASQVPYYEDIRNAKPKLDHVTAAAKAQSYQGADPEYRGFMRSTGFADVKIITDARFRLAEALRNAAPHLISSAAAKPIIDSFHPRPHLSIHGVLSRTGGVI
jgi:hypothetical protein